MTLAAIELPHFLILGWMALGVVALWIAHRLKVSGKNQINILLPMAIGLVVFTLYMNTRDNYEFMFDDVETIERHPDVRAADGWKTLWTHDYLANQSIDQNLYRPITILSYWINARLPLGGKIQDGQAVEVYPRYFRGVNMVLLAALGWLLALWLNTYVQQTASWLAAFLFVAHPSNAVLINYVVGRADLLALLGIIGFLYIQRLALVGKGVRWWHSLLAILFAMIAFGSKESGILLVPAAAIQAWIGRRNADSEVTDYIPATPRRTQLATVVWILLPLTLYIAGRVSAIGHGVDYANHAAFIDDMSDNPLTSLDMLDRAPASVSLAWSYMSQIVAPDTSHSHIPAFIPAWRSAPTILGLTTILVGVMLLFASLRRKRWLAIGLTVAIGQYLLVSNLITPIGDYESNRLMLPFMLCGVVIVAQWVHGFCLQSTRRRAVAIIPAIVIVLMMSSVVQEVNFHWGSEARLIGRDRLRDPSNPTAQYNFAVTRSKEGRSSQLRARAIAFAIQLIDRIQDVKDTDPISKRIELDQNLNRLRNMMQPVDSIPVMPRHPDQFPTLKETPRRLYQAIGQLPHLLETKIELDALKERLHDELKESKNSANRYIAEAIGLLEHVVHQRQHSVNARMQLATALEYATQTTQASNVYLSVAIMPGKGKNIHRLEAKVRYGWLSIESDTNRARAIEHLIEAEEAIETLLADTDNLVPNIQSKLDQLNKDAKRYLSILAFMNNDTATAKKWQRDLHNRYSENDGVWDNIPDAVKARILSHSPNG